MTNLEKYERAFHEAFETEEDVTAFSMSETEKWDSICHMFLMSAIEEAFEIQLETEEMLGINSFEAGKQVLAKKGIEF